MFHKALWMRTYKQGKYVMLLFWLSSLYKFPYQYYSEAQSQLGQSNMKFEDYTYYYSYTFYPYDSVILQSAILIVLACLLIGWERSNQSADFLWSMPFKRKDIFLTKWLFGVVNIIIVNIVCWISMYGVKKLSFHNPYQEFSPFHTYFLYATIILLAVYTFALFIGTITGNLFSQGSLTTILLLLPYGLILLVSGFVYAHTGDSTEELYKIEDKTRTYLQYVNIFAPLDSFNIVFDYHPAYEFDQYGNEIATSPNVDPMEHTTVPSAWKLLTPFLYIVLFFPIAIFLYTQSPNEQNGKILLFPKLQKWLIGCAVLCFSLLSGRIFGMELSLFGYYISFFSAGIVSYILLHRLLKWKFSFGGR